MNFHCQICSRDFVSKRSLQSHVNHHNITYREKHLKAAKISCARATIALQNKSNTKRDEYYLNPIKCLFCNKSIEYNNRFNKFCSSSCSASLNNKKRKIAPYKKQVHKRKIQKIRICEICSQPHYINGKTCSKQCKNKLLSISRKKLIEEGSWNPKSNRGRHKKSYLESSFHDWLNKHKQINFVTEYKFKRYKSDLTFQCAYYVDFFFPDLNIAIELDGSQHEKTKAYDQDRDQYIYNAYNVKIFRITHDEYIKKNRIKEIKSLLSLEDWSGQRDSNS